MKKAVVFFFDVRSFGVLRFSSIKEKQNKINKLKLKTNYSTNRKEINAEI